MSAGEPWLHVSRNVPRLGEVVDISLDGETAIATGVAWHPGSIRIEEAPDADVTALWWRTHRTTTNDGLGGVAAELAGAHIAWSAPLEHPARQFKVGDEAAVIWIPPPDPDNALLIGLEYLGARVVVIADEGELLRVQTLPGGATFFASDRMLGPPGTTPLLDPEVEAVAWAIVQALHVRVPEAERPQGWSDVQGDQEQLIRGAAVAAIEKLDELRRR